MERISIYLTNKSFRIIIPNLITAYLGYVNLTDHPLKGFDVLEILSEEDAPPPAADVRLEDERLVPVRAGVRQRLA